MYSDVHLHKLQQIDLNKINQNEWAWEAVLSTHLCPGMRKHNKRKYLRAHGGCLGS